MILTVENLIKLGKSKYGARVLETDSFSREDNISYRIDYENNSSTAMGGKSKGSIYIRGVKSEAKGIDSFKFVMEKSVDFCDLDA